MPDRSDKVFLLLILVGLAAAFFLALVRSRVEQGNRTVEIVVDADDARQLAMAAGLPAAEVVSQLRSVGISALAVREVTVGELVALGQVLPVAVQDGVSLVSPDTDLLAALALALYARLPRAELGIVESATPAIAVRHAAMDQLVKVPVFLRPEDVRSARAAGLRIVGRLMNYPAASPEAMAMAAARCKSAGARLVIFREDQVLGFPDLIGSAADSLEESDLLYGHVEIINQKGSEALSTELAPRLVRVHSITDADMQTLSSESALARYLRAVAERGVRVCYVRLFLRPQADPLGKNANYLARLVAALDERGYRVGPPAPVTASEGWPPRWARVLTLLALPAAFTLLLRRVMPLRAARAWVVLLVIVGLGAALGAPRWRHLVTPISGVAAACLFPSLSLVWAAQWARHPAPDLAVIQVVGRALIGLIVGSLITLAGAILLVGIHSPVQYLQGIALFRGVKLAYLAPLALPFLVVVTDAPGGPELMSRWWTRVRLRASLFFRQPITIFLAAVVLVALGVLVFAVSRSGNQPALAPTGGELKARGLLEALLFVRPRTKEFLLGHPALMLLVALSLRGRRAWLPLVVVLAGVGQISLINTFCHFHSPLLISLIRTGNGLWLGALAGVAVVVLWRLLLARPVRTAGP